MADEITDIVFTCEGGLNQKDTQIELAQFTPGAATRLINFEPGIYGGYRRIDGYDELDTNYGEVDSTNAEGKILGVFIYNDEFYAMRKQQSGTTYKVYKLVPNTGWVAETLGFTLNTTDGTKTIEWIDGKVISLDGTEVLVLADGVNFGYMLKGTTWTQIKSTNTGADFANAGGNQALDKPSRVESYRGHLFLAGDYTAPGAVAHSAPQKEFDFLVANGAGQVVTGFSVEKIKVWRDFLYCFGREEIGHVSVNNSNNFVFQNVSTSIGTLSARSVVELDGNLIYLAQDGFRVIEGTDKIDDVNIETRSKKVQRLVYDLTRNLGASDVTGVTIPAKSQARFYWNNSSVNAIDTRGVIVGIRERMDGTMMNEWGELVGIRPYVTFTGRVNNVEYVIHGDYDGKVYRMEQGNSFNGSAILSVYRTPFINVNAPLITKTLRDVHVFIETESALAVNVGLNFDWGDPDKNEPTGVILDESTTAPAFYGTGVYGVSTYGTGLFSLFDSSLQGTCKSVELTFANSSTNSSFAIQTIMVEFTPDKRR